MTRKDKQVYFIEPFILYIIGCLISIIFQNKVGMIGFAGVLFGVLTCELVRQFGED